MVHDVVAFDRGIDHREVLERLDRGLHEEGHEAELHAVFLLEAVLVFRAQVHHGLEVDLVERGELRLGVLRFEQALGDARAQARHRHALILAAGGADRGGAGAALAAALVATGRLGGRLVQILDDITLGDAAIAARGRDLRRIELLLFDHAAHRRRELAVVVGGGGGRGRRSCRGGGRRRGGLAARCRSGSGALFEHGQHLAAGHRGAGDDAQFLEHAVDRRRNFEHHLVGFEVGEILVAGDRLAGLLVPGDERGVGDRLGQLRNLDFDGHEFPVSLTRRGGRGGGGAPSSTSGAWFRAPRLLCWWQSAPPR